MVIIVKMWWHWCTVLTMANCLNYGKVRWQWWLWWTMVIIVNYGDYCDYGDCGDYGEEWWMSHQRHHMRITSFWAKKVYSIHPGLNEELDLYGGQECDIKSHLDNISLCVHLSTCHGQIYHRLISCHTPPCDILSHTSCVIHRHQLLTDQSGLLVTDSFIPSSSDLDWSWHNIY